MQTDRCVFVYISSKVVLNVRNLFKSLYIVIAFQLRRYQEAEDLFLRARALSPELWDVYKEYGMFLLLQGRYADAVPVLRQVR